MKKDKLFFTFTLVCSFCLHMMGFVIVKIKFAEAQILDEYVEVGLWESKWNEPLIQLPGESDEDQEIFKNSEIPAFNDSSAGSLVRNQKVEIVEVPKSNIMENDFTELQDVLKNESKTSVDIKLKQESFPRSHMPIEGPAAKRIVIFKKYPDYPIWARKYGLEFEVRLKFWLLSNGEVGIVEVEDSSGYPEIDEEVAKVMKRWKFNDVEDSEEMQWGSILFKFRLKR